MGMGAGNVMDRMAASVGDLSAVEPEFQAVSDVPNGGVLFAVPALLAVGLLHQAHKYFQLPKGYYGLESLFLMLAFVALARLPSLEQLRYCAPGEWGKLLGFLGLMLAIPLTCLGIAYYRRFVLSHASSMTVTDANST